MTRSQLVDPRTWQPLGRLRTAPWASYRQALRRTPLSLWNDDISDWAAALTYYAMLALLPAMLVTVSAVSLADPAGLSRLAGYLIEVAPGESGNALERTLTAITRHRSAAWLLTVVGVVSALWSSCSYLAVFRRALHAMYGIHDNRPAWRKAPRILGTALILLALLLATAFALIVSGPLARSLGQALGLADQATAVWSVLRWPLLLVLAGLLVLILFHSGPPAARTVRRTAPGGLLAIVLWLAVSAGFALYLGAFHTVSRLYGSLAGAVVFLIWLWLSNFALLTGAQFNAEIAKAKRQRSGGSV
ncbi:YihY/virulence factor BrkB family protein [Streptomyces sp. A7024]|uniref:YihY/virulence factor BrkB family protein n=1 Tax=Streptomyces coryli TaxID=1128680 RepID=A0A6G4TXM3_9ACTN|nr:YihY/virulence factor BrkB family protein [Streptomyces coryli]NGN64759.1 YihY/virulence factor BrkB family protein [Streptomyces coryli]